MKMFSNKIFPDDGISWEPSIRIFVDLETEAKPRFLNYEDQRVWFLIDLEKGMIHELPK